MKFPRALRELREKHGIGPQAMADLMTKVLGVEIQQPAISRVEKGEFAVTETWVERYAKALGLDYEIRFIKRRKR